MEPHNCKKTPDKPDSFRLLMALCSSINGPFFFGEMYSSILAKIQIIKASK